MRQNSSSNCQAVDNIRLLLVGRPLKRQQNSQEFLLPELISLEARKSGKKHVKVQKHLLQELRLLKRLTRTGHSMVQPHWAGKLDAKSWGHMPLRGL